MPTDLVKTLRGIGIRASEDALHSLLQSLTKSRASPVQSYEQLAELEQREREAKNLEYRTKSATLGKFKALDRFDWNHPRTIDRALYEALTELDFLERAENVLFRGPCGVGKTNLSQVLGLLALQKGHTVKLVTLAEMLSDLSKQESLPALDRRMHRYTDVDLLILDEFGYLPADARAADMLYNVVSRRHERRSIIVTTNLSYKQWTTVFPGAACVAALVDRFAQHCHVMDIDADSWRQKEALARVAQEKGKKK